MPFHEFTDMAIRRTSIRLKATTLGTWFGTSKYTLGQEPIGLPRNGPSINSFTLCDSEALGKRFLVRSTWAGKVRVGVAFKGWPIMLHVSFFYE
jgi:hypothetical protein